MCSQSSMHSSDMKNCIRQSRRCTTQQSSCAFFCVLCSFAALGMRFSDMVARIRELQRCPTTVHAASQFKSIANIVL